MAGSDDRGGRSRGGGRVIPLFTRDRRRPADTEPDFYATMERIRRAQMRSPRTAPPPDRVRVFRLRVDLDQVDPPVWRLIQVDGDTTLDELHDILQIAVGWSDIHLHAFREHGDPTAATFLTAHDIEVDGETYGIAESGVRLDQLLRDVGDRVAYEYDFGDGWEHTIRLVDAAPRFGERRSARCLDGLGACPPEDVGGAHAYNGIVAALAGGDDGPEEASGWLPAGFDPFAFDLHATDAALRRLRARPAPALVSPAADVAESMAEGVPDAVRAVLRDLGARAERAATVEGRIVPPETRHAIRPWRTFLQALGGGRQLRVDGSFRPSVVAQMCRLLGPVSSPGMSGDVDSERKRPTLWVTHRTCLAAGLVEHVDGWCRPTAAAAALADDQQALTFLCALPMLGRPDESARQVRALLLVVAAGQPVESTLLEKIAPAPPGAEAVDGVGDPLQRLRVCGGLTAHGPDEALTPTRIGRALAYEALARITT